MGPRTRFAAAGRTEFPAERPSPVVHPDDPQQSSRPIVMARLPGGSSPATASQRRPPAALPFCSIQRGAVRHRPPAGRVPAKSPQPPLALKRKLASRCRTILMPQTRRASVSSSSIAPTRQSHWAPRQPRRHSNSWARRSRPSAEANPAKWDAVRMHDTQNHAGSVPTATKPAQLAWPPFGGREPCFIPTPAYRIKQ